MDQLPPGALALLRKTFPDLQAIYLFGSHARGEAGEHSDIDIAVLLAPASAKTARRLQMDAAQRALEDHFHRAVDLINLRQVDTVLQKEVVNDGLRVDCGDVQAADEFEMLTLSYYQRLNRERADIIEDALATGRFHAL